MPSVAYKTFQYNLVDASRLIKAYNELSATGPDRRPLGHVTRSIVVSLCASWEQYIEDVAIELVRKNVKHKLPTNLQKSVQITICNNVTEAKHNVTEAKHNLKPLKLAGTGWRRIYLDCSQKAVTNFHSPKSDKVATLFEDYIGIADPVWRYWSFGKENLDNFVDVRNRIAHKGRSAKPATRFKATQLNKNNIMRTVLETDNFLYDQLSKILPKKLAPWHEKAK